MQQLLTDGAALALPSVASVTVPVLVVHRSDDRGRLLWLSFWYGPGDGALFADPRLMALADLNADVGDGAADAWAACSATSPVLSNVDVAWRLTLDPEGTRPREYGVEGRSLTAAFAIGLLAVAAGRQGATSRAVIGDLDREGRVKSLGAGGEYFKKLEATLRRPVDALIVPHHDAGQVEEVAERLVITEDLRLTSAHSVIDLAQLVAEDEWTYSAARGRALTRRSVGHIPRHLQPREPFLGRDAELAQLVADAIPESVVPVVGPPESGRSQLVAHALVSIQERAPKASALAPVVLDLSLFSQGSYPVTRCIAERILQWELPGLDGDTALASSTGESQRRRVVAQLSDELGTANALLVVDNADSVLARAPARADLDALLSVDELFDRGMAIVVSIADLAPSDNLRRKWRKPLRLGPVDRATACQMLAGLLPPDIEASAVADLLDTEVFYPGLIELGVSEWDRRRELPRTADGVADAVLDTLGPPVTRLLGALGIEIRDPYQAGPIEVLMAAALLHHYSLRTESFAKVGLSTATVDRLRLAGLLVEVEEADGLRLSGLLQFGLRYEVKRTLSEEHGPERADGLVGAVAAVVSVIADDVSDTALARPAARAVEAALSWIEDESLAAPAALRLRDQLLAQFANLSADEPIFPFSAHESQQLADHFTVAAADASLDDRIATLVLAARSGQESSFFVALGDAVDALVGAPSFSGVQLQAVDSSAFQGQLDHFDELRILEYRSRLVDRLRVAALQDSTPLSALKRIFYWLLHTADLALRFNRVAEAGLHRDVAAEIVERLPRPRAEYALVGWLVMQARARVLDSRLARSRVERLSDLRSAAASASEASRVGTAIGRPTAFGLHLRIMRQLVSEVSTDDERTSLVDGLVADLVLAHGPQSQSWPLEVRAQVSALIRHAAETNLIWANRVEATRHCIALLEPAAPALAAARLGEPRHLLTLARAYMLLGRNVLERSSEEGERHLQRALDLATTAARAAPTADGWALRLRLIDELAEHGVRRRFDDDEFVVEQSVLPADLQAAIKACRAWVETQERSRQVGRDEGLLLLWCRRREWRAQGDLDMAAQGRSRGDWMSLPSTEKRQLRTAEYRTRMAWLVHTGRKYGPSVELYEARIWLESQYRRLDALETAAHSPDLAQVLDLFDDARKALGPRDRMELLKGQFFRYVWRYEAAVEVLRPLVAGAADASIRASAAVVLTRALLDAATYSQALKLSGSLRAERELVVEAEKHLDEAVGVRGVSNEVAVLRARISVELGRTVELSHLDETFDLVFGSDYLATAMKNLDQLRSPSDSDPADLGAAVEHDFTDSDLLVQFGQLYMRSSVLRDGSDEAVLDLWKAYVVFDACRVLERSGGRHERSTTSYLLGRAILAAATLLRDSNPFPVRSHGKKSLLHFAEGRLQSAASRSVGGFYEEARRRVSEAQLLIRHLESQSS